jgi:hypothetical protein
MVDWVGSQFCVVSLGQIISFLMSLLLFDTAVYFWLGVLLDTFSGFLKSPMSVAIEVGKVSKIS